MNQLHLDFSKNINQRFYTFEENQIIDELVSNYKTRKNNYSDVSILTELFFEKYCIEILIRLKSDGYFEGNWSLSKVGFGTYFYNYLNSNNKLDESTIIDFVKKLIDEQGINISQSNWKENDVKKFEFDRKIADGFIKLIIENQLEKAIMIYIGYTKIWNDFKIYNNPFNYYKGIVIHKILSEALWPKKNISYDMFSNMESHIAQLFKNINKNTIYLPFFDKKIRDDASVQYLTEKEKLNTNINNLFEYDNTDENESYTSLIENLIGNPSEEMKSKQRQLIKRKVDKFMYPTNDDVDTFYKLYIDKENKKYGELLLSKFYFFNKILF